MNSHGALTGEIADLADLNVLRRVLSLANGRCLTGGGAGAKISAAFFAVLSAGLALSAVTFCGVGSVVGVGAGKTGAFNADFAEGFGLANVDEAFFAEFEDCQKRDDCAGSAFFSDK